MKKFKHKKTGDIIYEINHGESYNGIQYYCSNIDKNISLPESLLKGSNDWKEVIEYPVGTKVIDTFPLENKIYEKLPDGKWKLGSEEYFIIPDSRIGKGKRFQIVEEDKKPLFKTEDGVDIFEGTEIIFFHKESLGLTKTFLTKIIATKNQIWDDGDDGYLRFSNMESAEEYIILNKPCLSIKDVEGFLIEGDIEELKQFVKSKI
jgi:hypothetical protein